jgi:hypothetical protein
MPTEHPWEHEQILIQRLVLPLNLEHNAHSTFREELAAIRAQCRRRADANRSPRA